ncbi:exodeoxyribonuclease V subunit beta [Variovorax dokdonensis]|uniref:RecBCD enzyme subunit RecB n=1 Tax=Variovorax dokdonensis TaxID=344883 RepID=A0ABT7N7N0_9BURK|nr:exodeoxyribonuclease V subunit beta [Variovorax dokdonensis]MDM0043946.1 exodeoxyribonuclease V subunit beta [Variovorax dokdonensis]
MNKANDQQPRTMDALRFPLRGSQLVEASAGTGKTFTIAALYLRLVLGHGGEASAFARALTPPEILVVTFTQAATQELRDRIRARLAQAAQAFLAEPDEVESLPPGRDLLHDLRAEYPADQWPHCARVLRLAAEWMDEAAVSTIHGWCYRMLHEHAFDSGSPFIQTLEADQRDLLAEAARDYWRTFFNPLEQADARQVRQWWATPEALCAEVERVLPVRDALAEGDEPAVILRRQREDVGRSLQAWKTPWREGWVDELRNLLDDAAARKLIDGRKLQARNYNRWLDLLRQWAADDAVEPFDDKNAAWSRLTPEGILDASKDGKAAFDHPALHDLATLQQRIASLPDGRAELLRHALHWIAQRLELAQARRAQMGFDELLTRLDAALQGPNGARLAGLIRAQFPVALIDEFQDTDPLQYRIFDAVYRVAENAQDSAVVLIGDPKQAIYGFRGADIHTYLAARRDTDGRHHTLGTNFRSSHAMVTAVNRVFEGAEVRPDGAGAFGFRDAATDENPVPFVPVAAQGRKEQWRIDGVSAPALTFWTMPAESGKKGEAVDALATSCAGEIVRLLMAGAEGRAGFMQPDGKLQPLGAGDIAVLVNTGREAQRVRAALRDRGVRSVYLSDMESVFASPVAGELQRWLRACAEPDDDRPLRAALATPSLGLDWAALDALNQDELQWEERVLQFRHYQQLWRRQGVLPMLRHLLHDFDVPQRLLALQDERRLTDLLHLAELLQQASSQLDGEHALIRWLSEQRDVQGMPAEGRKLRLESDAALVKVVTVHKSKGLEFPLVFLPFAIHARAVSRKDMPLRWHDEEGQLRVALAPDDEGLRRADDERLGEDLRKLYVALTRARHATWVGVMPESDKARSALGQVLGDAGPVALCAGAQDGVVAVLEAPAPSDAQWQDTAPRPELAPPPPLPSRPPERWWIASYSALRHLDMQGNLSATDGEGAASLPMPASNVRPLTDELPAGPDSAADDIYLDSRDDAAAPQAQSRAGTALASLGRLHDFPAGSVPGSFLHGLLEWAGRQGFARVAEDEGVQAELARWLERRCAQAGWQEWAAPLQAWLLDWLATPLRLPPEPGHRRAVSVAPSQLKALQIEMEFLVAAQHVDALMLDELVRRHTLGGAPRPALLPRQVNGMLKGFVDLVFEHDGRYWVADYKSNWLGKADADYGPDALRQSVLQHRYELQYVLYVFALHRLLRARLPGYDYERHVGGAVYLFLRGHAAPGQGVHAERLPRALIDALDRMFDGLPPAPPPAARGQMELEL